MSDRSTGRTSIRGKLGVAFASAFMVASLVGTVSPVAAASPMTITNVDSPDPVASGAQIQYTITVTNTGGAKVTEAVLTDQVNGVVGFGNPPLLDVVSTRGGCTQANTQITCNAGTIEGGGVWTVTVRGIVTAPGGTTINNIATVTATKSATTFTNSASSTTQVTGSGPGGPSPDLTIGKNGPLTVTPGGSITYTLTVNNVGTANAVGIKVRDTVPAAVTITGITATSLFSCPTPPVASNTIECTNGRVNAGANGTITISGTVAAAASGQLENTSVVDPDNTIDEGELGNTADAAELNNQSNTVVTTISPVPPPPNPVISIDAIGPATAIPNEVIHYTLTVTNGSLGRADYVTVTNGTQGLQAASLKVDSATAPDGGTTPICTVSAPTVTCTMTRLPVGGHVVVKISGTVIAAAGSTIIDSAKVTANVKNTGYSATDEVQTIINAGIDLTITKSDVPDPVCASSFPGMGTTDCKGGLTYIFIVGNSGVLAAHDVLVRDPLPPGTTYDDAATDAANGGIDYCDEGPVGVVNCVIPTLAAGSTLTIKVVVTAPSTLGTITNTVTVDPNNAIFEADETNNVAVEKTVVATGIDLTIKKDDETKEGADTATDFNIVDSLPGFDPIATSGTQTYRITVDNTGTQSATGIHVRDILPAGTIFLTAEEVDLNGATFPGLHGFTCTHDGSPTGGNVDCVGGSLLGTADEFYFPPAPGEDKAFIEIKIFARPTVGIMHNEVRVDPLNTIAEYDEADNIEFEDTTVVTGNGGIGSFNQLRITKTQVSPVPPAAVATNGTVIYNLHIENLGTDPVSAVVAQDFLPTGSRFISAADTDTGPAGLSDAFLCTHDGSALGGTITCTGGAFSGSVNTILEDDGTTPVPTFRDIRVTMFAPNTPGTYPNISKVDPFNAVPEGNEFDNTSTINTLVSVGGGNMFNELTITKTASPSTLPSHATPGGLITYTITVFNLGTDPAFNVKVTDNLPTGTTFVSATDTTPPPGPDSSDFTCSFSSGVVTCLGATLDGSLDLVPAVPTTREITIKVRAPLENVIGLLNVVRVDPDNTIAESNETNNSAAAATDVQSDIDLVIEKSGPKAAHQNDFTEYVLTVKNLGPATANDVLVVDPLPVGLIVLGSVVATPGNFTCTVQENPVNVVTCVGDLNGAGDPNNFDEVTITIPVFITASSGTLDNQACVDPNDTIVESNEDNNCSTNVTPVVKKAPNLLINKSADKPTVTAGDQITYTLSISNIGDAAADGPVTVTDILPTQVDFVSANPDASFTCPAPVGGTLTCTAAGGLAVGASASITIIVTAQSPLPPGTTSIVNEASVSFGTCTAVDCENEAVDPNRTHDNSTTVTSNVGGSAIDLVINSDANFDTPDPVVVGQKLTHTIVVANTGSASTTTDPAPNLVVVRVNLPAGLDLDSAAASGGFACIPVGPEPGPVGNVDCSGNLAAGATTTVTISSTVTATAGSSLTVTAEVDPDHDIVESNEGNNSRTAITSVVAAPCTSCIDLVMGTIFATPNPVANNNNITYNFAVTNVGDLSTTADPVPHNVVVAINLDTIFNESTVVSASAPGFSCVTNSPPVPVSAPEIVCTNTTGLAGGGGSLFSVVVFASTAATPSFVDFDVSVDPTNQISEFNEGNNLGSLRVNTF